MSEVSGWQRLPYIGTERSVRHLGGGVRLRAAGAAWALFVDGARMAGGRAGGSTAVERHANAKAAADAWARDSALALLREVRE